MMNTIYISLESAEWFATAINRGAQHLDVDTLRCPFTKDLMPLDIYKSKTLVSLKLVNVGMGILSLLFLYLVSRSCIEDIQYSDEDPLIMEKLISGCPVLEDLTVCRFCDDNVPVLRVRSQILERFCVRFAPWRRMGGKEYAVEIDAPGLKYMNLGDNQSERILVKNLSSLFMINIDTCFNVQTGSTLVRKNIHEFLTGISSCLHFYLQRVLNTIFHNLSRFEASFCDFTLLGLGKYLESFPNLKHLTLYVVYLTPLPEILKLTNVPQCLLSTLECVEIKEVITREATGLMRVNTSKKTPMEIAKDKKKLWMKLVRYFLENSVVLKNLILSFTDSDISKELLTFTNVLTDVKLSFVERCW